MSEQEGKKPGISARRRFADIFWLVSGILLVVGLIGWIGYSAAGFYAGGTGGSQSSSGGLFSMLGGRSDVQKLAAVVSNFQQRTGSYPASPPTDQMIAQALGDDEAARRFAAEVSISGLPSSSPGDLVYLPVRDEDEGRVVGYMVVQITSPGNGREFPGESGRVRLVFGGDPPTGAIGEIEFDLPGGSTPREVLMDYGSGENVNLREVPAQ